MPNQPVAVLSQAKHDKLIQHYKLLSLNSTQKVASLRERFAAIDKEYYRENDRTYEGAAAKAANAAGDVSKHRNIIVPVVMPQVETAVTYLSTVFLTGDTVFGVVAPPDYADAALQMSTIIQDNAEMTGWQRQLIMHFRDGKKYNFCPIEVSWASEVSAAIETDTTNNTNIKLNEVVWSGNKLRRLDPYNTFMDFRVSPTDVYKDGEFAGFTELLSRIKLKELVQSLPEVIVSNLKSAYESAFKNSFASNVSNADGFNYHIPEIVEELASIDRDKGTNWFTWVGLQQTRKNIDYKEVYEVTTLYCKIIPSEFGFGNAPKANTPQVYKLIIVNHEVIIYCTRLTNAHNWLPILIGQPNEDGLGLQTKSLAENSIDFQHITTSLMTSIIQSRRRAISDRTYYDPSRISKAHMNNPNPAAKIPVRSSAYNGRVADAVHAFPYREDQGSFNLASIQTLLSMSNQLVGQNPARQGQFVKGNKTQDEFNQIMDNSSSQDRISAILYEYQVFAPMKLMIKSNILQYQGGVELYNRSKEKLVEIDPIKLRKAILAFKLSDGLLPSSKLMKAEVFAVVLQQLGTSPELASRHDVGKLFSYFVKMQGADISEFEKPPEQVAYEQAAASWERMAMLLIEKGGDIRQLPPQPKPQDYGWQIKDAPEEVFTLKSIVTKADSEDNQSA